MAVLLSVCPPARLPAQARPAAPLYRYGKWVGAGLAVGFTALGIRQHNGADDAYSSLLDYCATGGCALGPDGHYADPTAEARYRDVVHGDRTARAYFLGGQAALAGAVAMFILELHHAGRDPANIPYSGLTVTPDARGMRVGWRFTVP